MAAEMEQEHQNEQKDFPDPIFFRKKSLTEEVKQELENSKSALEDQKRKVKDLWQATAKVVKERHEANLALNKSLLLKQNQEPAEASTSDTSRRKENTAPRVEFDPEMGDQAVAFYRMWIGEFKKNASRQREVVRDSVEKLFDFLHQFDDEEPQPIKKLVPEGPLYNCLYYLSLLLLFVACVLFIFEDYDLLKCDDDILICFHENIITLAFKIRNFYFNFHNITNDYSNVTDTGYLSNVAYDASGS